MKLVFGVDHVGIGVRDMKVMKSFYGDVLGFTRVLGEMPEADHEPMHAVVRRAPAVHSGILLAQDSGGTGLALFHMVDPAPRPIRHDFRYGDVGVSKMTIGVEDVDRLFEGKGGSLNFCSAPKSASLPGWDPYRFVYSRDPEGNLIEFVTTPDHAHDHSGIGRSLGIGVTDLERSASFYQERLSFDRVVVETHEAFSGLVDEVSGGFVPARRTRHLIGQ
jgi:catechol 2,3-dioxygenase-like lactoylglutathione lyase family enzyme